eukprot:NODE_1517_length_530_cov_65.945946_g1440_i0.p2 GENE.NODE_1517_length_530_cov_65.945946_g1440_i0~~NODE_1517_length_530_cov_65.945946_g1440_i0.p2  ORF type:complete len:170 (+),score=46.79 NODE_1517_length_530_cov_65.945946_g1440_i0:27-512(+)
MGLHYCNPEIDSEDLVQVACYGLGVGCAHGQIFQPFVADAVARLTRVVSTHKDKKEWASAVCNAVFALVKAHQHHSEQPCCADAAILPTILSALPVKGDEDQGQVVHARFVELVQSGNAVVLGTNNSNQQSVTTILKSLQGGVGGAFADEPTKGKIAQMLQ